MNRRDFLLSVGAAVPSALAAQQKPVPASRPSRLTAGAKPAIAINHLGFLPKGGKRVVFRLTGPEVPTTFTMREIGSVTPAFSITRPLTREPSDLGGECLVGDFSDVERIGMYQITIGDERSVPFFIRQDVWRRTLPKVFSFYPQKRCGVAVPNVHPVCHLDDGRRRDNGQYINTTGGWHDAGDLRKQSSIN